MNEHRPESPEQVHFPNKKRPCTAGLSYGMIGTDPIALRLTKDYDMAKHNLAAQQVKLELLHPSLAFRGFGAYQAKSMTVVRFTCPTHGDMEDTIRGMSEPNPRGCKLCRKASGLSNFSAYRAKLLERTGKDHNVIAKGFEGIDGTVTLVCEEHGEVSLKAKSLLYNDDAGCPICGIERRSLGNVVPFPEFVMKAKAVHSDRYVYVEESYTGTASSLRIICAEHGEFTQNASSHLAGKGCLLCGYESSAAKQAYSAQDFVIKASTVHNNKYTYVADSFVSTKDSVTVVCSKHGAFTQTAGNHLSGYGCKACGYESEGFGGAISYAEFKQRASSLYAGKYTYTEEGYSNLSSYVKMTCPEHGVFESKALAHLFDNSTCPQCKVYGTSAGELELFEFVKSLGVDCVSGYRYSRRQFDIYIPSLKLAIEYDGLCWHSTLHRTREEQLRKRKDAEALGVELIRVFEHEWVSKKQQVKSLLQARLGLAQRAVFARKCVIASVDNAVASKFHNANHIQGWNRLGDSVGLLLGNELVAVMTFTKNLSSRRVEADTHELIRFSSSCRVVGGASRLLKAYLADNPVKIISFSDKRLFSGKLYAALGFTAVSSVEPNYSYWKAGSMELKHKSLFRRDRLSKLLSDFDPANSERANCEAHGYYQVFDDGKFRWELAQ